MALVVPYTLDTDARDLTIETGILSLSSGESGSETEEVLEWNQEDITLFLALINRSQIHEMQGHPEALKVDLTDPEVIEIIHIVAAAGFGTAYTSKGLLKETSGLIHLNKCEIGAMATLNTISGFVSCVVVDLEDDDVVCVLLNDISERQQGLIEEVSRHDLLLVNRVDLLNPEFADDYIRPLRGVLH